jgi:hypothetical protein
VPALYAVQHLHHRRRTAHLRFGQQQMYMFRHDDIADDDKAITLARLFQDREESVPGARRTEEGQSPVAGTRNKVQVMRTVRAMQARGHDKAIVSAASYPPLQKTQEPALSVVEGTGHPQFRNGKEKTTPKGQVTRRTISGD